MHQIKLRIVLNLSRVIAQIIAAILSGVVAIRQLRTNELDCKSALSTAAPSWFLHFDHTFATRFVHPKNHK